MDPNVVVLEISSDEEGGCDGHNGRGITDDVDDHNWISLLFNEVNRDDCRYDHGDDDSDEVLIVSEVLPSRKPRKKLKSKSSSLIEFDDDCMVLDHDPNKPPEVQNDDPITHDEDDDSDDVLVVSEKGQVACRDYPHSRHLCIKFPFSSTPKQSHCHQCYCYVCDSLAPCVFWGNGNVTINHCHATDKDDFWKLEREKSKNGSKIVDTTFSNKPELMNPVPPTVQNPIPRLNPNRVCPVTPDFGATFSSYRNKYEPDLVSQQLIRTSSCTIPTDRIHHNYNLERPFDRPVFKRTVSAGVTRNLRYSGSSQSNIVNNSVPFSTPNHAIEEPLTRSNTPFDFPPNFEPLVTNLDSYTETPVLFQPQGHSPVQESQGQRSMVDPEFLGDIISWPQSETTHQLTNEPSLATGSVGLVDFEYDDNWMMNNQPCESRAVEVTGSFGLNGFSPEPGFVFDF